MIDWLGEERWRAACRICRWSKAQRQSSYDEERRGKWSGESRSQAICLLHKICRSVANVTRPSRSSGLGTEKKPRWFSWAETSMPYHYHSHLLPASRTDLIDEDPTLRFVLMLMPTGPLATN
jgi:hypothetical protein